ncbi:MAG TPA: hypothetical protein VK204_17680 [Nocardioidaceae bacterium]|nr:hypothetical protein [Nocardioidaceae bacterium]
MSRLGEVTALVRHDAPIMYLDVAFDVESIQAGWPEFESRFTSLRGRRMMAVIFPEQGIYRLATVMRDEDDPDALGLNMGVLPGGPYLQLSLEGDARSVHRNIGPAFEELRGLGEVDPTRPCIEVYRSPREVDCLQPVVG